jgi:hypothetical protein
MTSADIWLSGTLVVVSSISSIVLSIQRGISHSVVDKQRDPTDPFADTQRLTRITCSTLLLTVLACTNLIHALQHDDHHAILALACVAVSWLYALVLTLLSRHYRLPDPWGWTLNVHLFVIYLASLVVALVSAFQQIIVGHPNMPWIHALPYLLSVFLTLDLVHVTATVKQGARYLDDQHGRIVSSENISSIWGTLFFNWATPIFTEIAQKRGDFSDVDLPILTMPYRASNVFYRFCVSPKKSPSLFRRLVAANQKSLMMQVALAIVASMLYYLPTFLMNRMLQFLQDISEGSVSEHIVMKGALLVAGMGLSIVMMGITNAQLWYYGKME